MHLENFAPLFRYWPLVASPVVALVLYLWFEGGRRKRQERQAVDRDRRYWLQEFSYRARMRAKAWLTRTRTPRLTYQGPPILDHGPARAEPERASEANVVKAA